MRIWVRGAESGLCHLLFTQHPKTSYPSEFKGLECLPNPDVAPVAGVFVLGGIGSKANVNLDLAVFALIDFYLAVTVKHEAPIVVV